jgi:cytochrome c biogenesis protein CcmG/thiol:disulfide interchange protein DsbE
LPSTIEAVQRAYAGRGLVVLAVNLGEERDRVAAWAERQGVTSKILLDATGDAARDYGIDYTPTVFLVGRDGRLVGRAVGNRDWVGDKGRALLERLLGP